MKNKTILITGASSGIGAACVEQAAAKNLNIIATARNSKALMALQNKFNSVQIITADISTEAGRAKIIKQVEQPINFLFHNAANLDKPEKFTDIALFDFQKNMATNVEPIIFLTQGLLKNLRLKDGKSRILCVTSRAAINAYQGINNYCTSKAAALMACQMLSVELAQYGILVNNYSPGVVDTAMQKTLRSSKADIFSYTDDFIKLKTDNKLAQPSDVARHIIHTFCNSTDQAFSQSSWEYIK